MFSVVQRNAQGQIFARRNSSKSIPVQPSESLKAVFENAKDDHMDDPEELEFLEFNNFLSNDYREVISFDGVTSSTSLMDFKHYIQKPYSRIKFYFCLGKIHLLYFIPFNSISYIYLLDIWHHIDTRLIIVYVSSFRLNA